MSDVNAGGLIAGLCRDLDLSISVGARILEVDRRTVENWQVGHSVSHRRAQERLADLIELRHEMLGFFGSAEMAQDWLNTPSNYLGGVAPIVVLEAGRIDRVCADLEGLKAGVYL